MNSLLATLATLPSHWHLTVTNSNKQPLGYQWQKYPFSPSQLLKSLSNRGKVEVRGKGGIPYSVRPQGIGILCGQNEQEFLLAIDCDGESAHQKLKELAKRGKIPATVAFSSGRPGRAQYLFRLPGIGHQFKSCQIATKSGDTLEIRGTRLQSVLPPSPHPMTGGYRWLEGCSPDSVEVLLAPDWLLEVVNSQRNQAPKYEPRRINPQANYRSGMNPSSQIKVSSTSSETALLLLEVIHPSYADDYHTWIRVGMALKFISYELLEAWDTWSQLSPKYKSGECQYKWQSFRGGGISDRYLYFLAIYQGLGTRD